MPRNVSSKVTMYKPRIKELQKAQIRALELTSEYIHTELVQSQTMPFGEGALQGEKTFVDTSKSKSGYVPIVSEGPYARRLYYHPEYDFSFLENPQAGAGWFEPYLNNGDKHQNVVKAYRKLYKKEAGL